MVDKDLSPKEKARNHIVAAQGLLPYMNYEQGDYPYQQGQYKKHITDATKELKGVYPSNDIIFTELGLETDSGLFAALGGLDLGDAPFEAYKRNPKDLSNAETFEADTVAIGNLTELEIIVYINTDLFNILPHPFAPIRLVFRNDVAIKAFNLLEDQFAYDYDSFKNTGEEHEYAEWLEDANEGLITFVDWQVEDVYSHSDFALGRVWQGDKMPATVAFLQWNWAAIWCKEAVTMGLFNEGVFTRDEGGYNLRNMRDVGLSTVGRKDGVSTVRNMTAFHRIVSINKIVFN